MEALLRVSSAEEFCRYEGLQVLAQILCRKNLRDRENIIQEDKSTEPSPDFNEAWERYKLFCFSVTRWGH